MTIVRLADRVSALERRRDPGPPDPRVAAEARDRAVRGILGLLSSFEAGDELTSPIGCALVEHDFDICAACTALVQRRRLGWQ